MMFIMLGLYVVLSECSSAPLLQGLYGSRAGNRVTLCTDQGLACEGAAWKKHWMVARDSCLGATNTSHLTAWKGDINCSEANAKKYILSRIQPVLRYKVPDIDDVTLLWLLWPIPIEDTISNTTNGDLLTKLETYLSEIEKQDQNDQFDKQKYYAYQYMKKNSSPIKIFLLTVILPSAAFMVFFFFVIFYTGSKKSKGSHRPLLHNIDS